VKGLVIAASFAAGLAIAAAGPADASTAALTGYTGGLQATSGSDQLYGWIFDTSKAIKVDALGVGDPSGGPLAVAHDVGIYDAASQTLLGSVTVLAGSGGTASNGFMYQSVTPFTLAVGRYVIAMTMPQGNADLQGIEVTSLSTSPGITYVNSAFGPGSALAFPDPTRTGFFAPGMFGPNFTFNDAVPEPATWALMLAGFGGLGLALRVRRRARRAAA
jgi:hypothetical protein